MWIDDDKSFIADFIDWHARSVYFFDPAGNIVELIARDDLNDVADGAFSSRQFRNISETGLVLPVRLADASPLVRGMAVWALSQLAPPERTARLAQHWLGREDDASVLAEWKQETSKT